MATPIGAPSLGRSVQLRAGDLVFDELTGDLAVVADLPALTQALLLTIETQLGTDRLNASFGFDRLSVGTYAYNVHARKEYIKMQLVRCVGSDRRVRDVRDVFFEDDPRFFELQPSLDAAAQDQIAAAARASREYRVYVVIETIASETLTLQAGGTLG